MTVEEALTRPLNAAAVGAMACVPMAGLGTMVHEAGHWAVATASGVDATLHYGWVSFPDGAGASLGTLVGGPAANLAVSAVGAAVLWARRGRRRGLVELVSWLAAMCACRQVAVLPLRFVGRGDAGDEARIEQALALPPLCLELPVAVSAAVVCTLACLAVGRGQTAALVAGGAVGSALGGLLWFGLLGPWWLP